MAQSRSQIDDVQKKILLKHFQEGMNAVNRSTEELRNTAAKETGLSLLSVNHWINNCKKRNPDATIIDNHDTTVATKKRKVKKTSSYNHFSKDFNKTEEACGKTLGERSSLMAERWRSLSVEEKEVYERRVQAVKETPMGVLSAKEKKVIMMRIARRHQADANTAQQLGFQVASMYYLDGEIVTVGTRDGKAYLNSHPAILSTFQSQFLYDDFTRQSSASKASATTTQTDAAAVVTPSSPTPLSTLHVVGTTTTAPASTGRTTGTASVSTTKTTTIVLVSTAGTTTITAPVTTVSTTQMSTAPTMGTMTPTTSTQMTVTPTLASMQSIAFSSKSVATSLTTLLKNNRNVVIATGRRMEGSEVHGDKLRPGCCKVAINNVLVSGSKAWFPVIFGEDLLEKGAIVEWPLHYTVCGDNISPLTTKAMRKH